MFEFRILAQDGKARLGVFQTPHGTLETPCFLPVGSLGVVKAVGPNLLSRLGAQIMLANTFHLYLRPGLEIINKAGGLHPFFAWKKPILVDSGGFQIFSLGEGRGDFISDFAPKISSEGVLFKSPFDGTTHFFSPKKVIEVEIALGADIIMPLDCLVGGRNSFSRLKEAAELTSEWFSEAMVVFRNKGDQKKQALFGIIQGGTDKTLRRKSVSDIVRHSPVGYAIGGLSVGEEKSLTFEIVEFLDKILPKDKPRYLMGVGTPLDFLLSVCRGVDFMDCVLPTRLARHHTVWVVNLKKSPSFKLVSLKKELKELLKDKGLPLWFSEWLAEPETSLDFEQIDITRAEFREDFSRLMSVCSCECCATFSKAALHHFAKIKEPLLLQLLSTHNLLLMFDLERLARALIKRKLFNLFLKFLK